MKTIEINKKKFDLIPEPVPHIVLETKKELHGWYPGKRECTSERLLINPYNGCSVGCFYCYARALPGYFEIFQNEGIVFVSKDFDRVVSEQLDSINVASCGYLSPVTDPFQEINKKYHLSEKIIKVFVDRNLPIEFVTKSVVPDEVIELVKLQKHSFGQVSVITIDESLRKIFSPNGATTDEIFQNIYRLAQNNIFAVCRIDPIFPYITDKRENLRELIIRAVDSGANHIIASILDLPVKISDWILSNIKNHFGSGIYYDYKQLYTEQIGYINAKIDYRKKVFDFLRSECDRRDVTFALCMEYELARDTSGEILIGGRCAQGSSEPVGLNRYFMSSTNCEGIDIPVYVRKGEKFFPAADCLGNCLNCRDAKCGIAELAMASLPETKKDFRLRDYKCWSKTINTPVLI
ncbi:MAG: hypothetical protein QME68_01135 [Elusimicrobiota bacterium]|nr:hypothetical protein [Elusimicrobiota bacterium]